MLPILYLMANKALITGSNGFIGKHLWDALVEQDIEPIALDRHDLYIEVPNLTRLLFAHKPDYIFHLAAYGNMRGQNDSTQAIMANYFGTYNLLKATEFLDYKAFINVGSSSMYGRKMLSMKETDSLEPDTFYAATKAGAAHLARAFAIQYKKPVMTVVPFSVYGEGESTSRFIPTVIEHLMTNKPLSLDLDQEHDWIHVDDLIVRMIKMIELANLLPGEMVNIGTGIATSNLEIVKILEEISGKKVIYGKPFESSKYDSPTWVADQGEATINLEQGLKRCWEYYSKL